MANYELKNDQVLAITLKATDAGGGSESLPAGDTFTATSDNATALNAVIGKDAGGNPALIVNALVQTASNVTVTVSDSAGLKSVSQLFDIVADTVPTNLVLDLADAVSTPQPVPAA